jgi:hypothetical protein
VNAAVYVSESTHGVPRFDPVATSTTLSEFPSAHDTSALLPSEGKFDINLPDVNVDGS